MIEQLIFAALATVQQPVMKKREDEIVIVGKKQPSPTVVDINELFERFNDGYSLATYKFVPIEREDNDLFVSPIKRSLNITTSIIVGGRVVQPSIDEDIVYFDE